MVQSPPPPPWLAPNLAENTMFVAMNENDRDLSNYLYEGDEYEDDDQGFELQMIHAGTVVGEGYVSDEPKNKYVNETVLMGSQLRKHIIHPKTGQGRNIGLFFGHENWNVIMYLMVGFRAGLKM